MNKLMAFVIVLLSVASLGSQEKTSTELARRVQMQQLREELQQTRIAVAQCRASLADAQAKVDSGYLTTQNQELKSEHDRLDGELRKLLGAGPGDEIDWSKDPPTLKKKS
jgi:uncharacterized protein YlxW (UPF0749 family)